MGTLGEVKEVGELVLVGGVLYLLYRGVAVRAFGQDVFSIGGGSDGSQTITPSPTPSPDPTPAPTPGLPGDGPFGSGREPDYWGSFLAGLNPLNLFKWSPPSWGWGF